MTYYLEKSSTDATRSTLFLLLLFAGVVTLHFRDPTIFRLPRCLVMYAADGSSPYFVPFFLEHSPFLRRQQGHHFLLALLCF